MAALVVDFNRMLAQLADRERELQQARDALSVEVRSKTRSNKDLEQALARLTETQAQLVQSEKLASLGALVAASRAHENQHAGGRQRHGGVDAAGGADHVRQAQKEGVLTAPSSTVFPRRRGRVDVDPSEEPAARADLHQQLQQVGRRPGQRRAAGASASAPTSTRCCWACAEAESRAAHDQGGLPGQAHGGLVPGAVAQILTTSSATPLVHAVPGRPRGHITISVRDEGGPTWCAYAYERVDIARQPGPQSRPVLHHQARRGRLGPGLDTSSTPGHADGSAAASTRRAPFARARRSRSASPPKPQGPPQP